MFGTDVFSGRGLLQFINRRPVCAFWCIAIVHMVAWVLVPVATQPNGPLDTLEMIYWGHEWQLGYYKHPPLPGWLAELVCIGRSDVWPTYVLAQLATLGCFWCAFELGRKTLGNARGVLAVLLLEGCYYYNFTTAEFNNNVTSRVFWALAVLCLYFSLTKGRPIAWMLTGVFLGLGMLSKYDTAILAIVMAAFSVLHPAGRSCWLRPEKRWRIPGPVICLLASLVVFAPHLYWLVQNDFPTVDYFLKRSEGAHRISTHITSPLNFAVAQLLAIAPVGLLAVPVLGWKWALRELSEQERINRDFLLWFCFGPFLLVILAGAVLGVHIRSMWGTAMWTYVSVAALFFIRSEISFDTVRRVLGRSAAFGLLALMVFGLRNTVLPEFRGKASRVHYPGRELAKVGRDFYNREIGGSPQVVAGPWWEAANVAFYMNNRVSKDLALDGGAIGKRASVYADVDNTISPWMTDQRFSQVGGVVVWERNSGTVQLEKSLAERFPGMRMAAPFTLRWQTSAELDPIEFAMAVVPPSAAEVKPVDADSKGEVLQARN